MEKETEPLKKRLIELADKSYQSSTYTYSNFLNLHEQDLFYSIQTFIPHVDNQLYGGHAYADRSIAVFGSMDMFGYESIPPVSCVKVSPLSMKFSDHLTNRDFLGALMSLNIERNLLGDILVEDNIAYVYCREHIAAFIVEELTKVKHTNVSCSIEEHGKHIEPKYREVTGFVTSCRLDAVIGLAFGLSRSQSIPYIQGKKVFINGRCTTSNSYLTKEKDVISVRGLGKFIYIGVSGFSKKGRSHILLNIFV